MRLIDADALMQTLGITDMDCGKCAWYSKAYRRCKRGGDFEDACVAIEDVPTVDAVQERKGRWIERIEDMDGIKLQIMRCSECGSSKPMKLFILENYEFNFCPNCGAHMEGAES